MTDRKYFSGNSIEQAVMNAARHFKLDPDDLDYRQMEKRHGFVKSRRSFVIEVDPNSPRKPLSDDEAYQRAMSMDPEAHLGRDPNDRSYVTDGPPRKRERSRRRGKGRQRKGQDNGRSAGNRRAEPTQPPSAGEHRSRRSESDKVKARSNGRRPERRRQPDPERPAAEDPASETRTPDRSRSTSRPGGERRGEDASDVREQRVRPARPMKPAGRGDRRPAEGPAADVALRGATDLLRLGAIDISASVYQGEEHLQIELAGADEDRVTRRRGEVLAALQQLVPSIVRSETGERVFCRVDCDGFREIHEERLRDLAQRVAGKVDRSKRAQVLESMNPAERRIIHLTLNDDPAVSTESLGKGYFKRVRISPV